MSTIVLMVILNLVLLLLISTCVALFLGDEAFDRWLFFMNTVIVLFEFSLLGWAIYVVVHFVGKYW